MIHYELHGEPSDRPVLLLTHGYGADHSMWAPNVDALASDRLVITWDMRGHGQSDAPRDPTLYSHDACLDHMAQLLDRAGTQRAVVGGMSLGGFLSLAFHLRHTERVEALLLVDTGPGFRDAGARERWNQWARELGDALERDGLDALPGGHEQRRANHVHGAVGLAHAARGMLIQQDSRVFESLRSIAVPALVVVGSDDTRFLAAADAMERRISGARKVVLNGAGHAANMDAPDEFNRAVREFLEAL